jgi:hypothetical protein
MDLNLIPIHRFLYIFYRNPNIAQLSAGSFAYTPTCGFNETLFAIAP